MSQKLSRRDFLKLSGVGAAASLVLTGCGPASRYVTRHPYTDMPEYNQTGVSTYYATTCRECPAGCGLIVRTMEGRAIKVEGNPNHPVNHGKVCSRGLTAVQGVYNPDRINGPMEVARGKANRQMTWDEAVDKVAEALKNGVAGRKAAFLMGAAPDHLWDFVAQAASYSGEGLRQGSEAGWLSLTRYSAYRMFDAQETLRKSQETVLGSPNFSYFDLAQADLVFSFGANFLETWISPLAYSQSYRAMRKGKNGRRGYLVSFEARQSLTSANADEWVPVKPGCEGLVAQAIGKLAAEKRKLDLPVFKNVNVNEVAELSGIAIGQIDHLADLFAKAETPLAIPGGAALGHQNGYENAQMILALNGLAKSAGNAPTISASPLDLSKNPLTNNLKSLVDDINAGKVDVLFIHGVNPVFETPAALGFVKALEKVKLVISFSSFPDETAMLSDYIFPDHTALESFGYQYKLLGSDRMAYSGSQPVVAPLRNTRATVDVLLAAAQKVGGELATRWNYNDEVDYLQQKVLALREKGGFYSAPEILTFWSQFLQHGGWWTRNGGLKPAIGEVKNSPSINLTATSVRKPGKGQFHLVVYPTQLGDGSGANRPWLQETPNAMTTATWGSWIEINPETAHKLGIKDDDIVKVTSAAGEIEVVAYLYPAIRPDTVAIPFGQGHERLGRYAEKRGANPARILEMITNQAGDLAYNDTLVTLTPTGKRAHLARVESRVGVYSKE